MDDEAFAAVEATLTELLGAAGLLVETRRRPGAEMLFELIGDDVEPLLANRGEGLNGLEVLTGRIASKRIGRPVYPRVDAEGFRAHQKESLEELKKSVVIRPRYDNFIGGEWVAPAGNATTPAQAVAGSPGTKPVSQYTIVGTRVPNIEIPPVVAFGFQHPWLSLGAFIARAMPKSATFT